jgi:hypothetical protein
MIESILGALLAFCTAVISAMGYWGVVLLMRAPASRSPPS